MLNIALLINNETDDAFKGLINDKLLKINIFTDVAKFHKSVTQKSYHALLILAELELDNKKNFELYGFTIFKDLRLRHSALPIFIISKFKSELLQKAFQNNKELAELSKALQSPEVYFTTDWSNSKKDTLIAEIQQACELDSITLKDIQYSFFSIKGQVHNIIHDLKNLLYLSFPSPSKKEVSKRINELIESGFAQIDAFLSNSLKTTLYNYKILLLKEIEDDLVKLFENNPKFSNWKYDNASRILLRYTTNIYDLFPDTENDFMAMPKKYKWECVAIDDTPEILERLKLHFERVNIKCHLFSSYQEAKETILKNEKVASVITDLRILNKDGNWNKYQGYKILSDIRKNCTRSLGYFVLTGKRGTVSNLIQKGIDFKVHWFIKEDVLSSEGAFNIFFFEHLAKESDSLLFKLLRQPRKSAWTKGNISFKLPLSLYYKIHTESQDYNEAEYKINDYVTKFLKGETKEYPEVSCKLWEKEVTDKGLNSFRRNILTARRIVYFLALEGYSGEEILHKLVGKTGTNREPKTIFNTQLAIGSYPEKDLSFLHDIENGEPADCEILNEELDAIRPGMGKMLLLNEQDYEILEGFLYDASKLFEKEVPSELVRVNIKFENFGKPTKKEIAAAINVCQNLKGKQIGNLLKQYLQELKSPPIKKLIQQYLGEFADEYIGN